MPSFAYPVSPFSGMTLSTCMGKNPSDCCVNAREQKAHVEVNPEYECLKLSYETGAEVIVSQEYQLVRSACHMLWLRDRFAVLHVLD